MGYVVETEEYKVDAEIGILKEWFVVRNGQYKVDGKEGYIYEIFQAQGFLRDK